MADQINNSKYSSKLAERIREFNSAFKLGVDLGTKEGGIALVKDNQVLFAKTFLDFHKENLKDRRTHRRNRRSRLAKKRRVAILRSWLLRQKVNGKQLPDPYKIKDTPLFKRTNAKNWIDAVVSKQDTSPEAFVRALTTVFRKRGQSYEETAKQIEDMDYRELKDYINSLGSITEEEFNALSEEIKYRSESSETSSEKNRYAGLVDILKTKLSNKENIKNRREREKELEQIVKAFCEANNVHESDKWISQLKSLLNKPIRKVRFTNRIVIRCNICDRPTPKKSRPDIRELLYMDVIRNFLRAGRIEPNEEAINYYKTLYKKAAEIRKSIIKKAPLTEEQKKLKKELSKQLKKYINKDYRASAQKKMLEQIKVLMFEKLSGRSRYCIEHLKARANGEDVEAGYHGHVQKRHDMNIAQKNHDKRVINLIEYMLFRSDESLAMELKNKGIMYITIEAPEPDTKKLKKGKPQKKDERNIKEKLLDEQFDVEGQRFVCIYTGQELSKDRLNEYEKDHIFPESRDGPSIRDNLVITTKEINKEKGDRTPWEWLHDDPVKWQEFKNRVMRLYSSGKITERKKELLLNEGSEFPMDNPTELARAGARVNNFIADLNEMLKKHGLPEAQTLFEKGKPIVQIVRGSETQRLRRQWNAIDPSFIPLKDRAVSFNHAEDAVIAASMPPTFWRSQIYRYTWHFAPSKERSDFALPDIAPNWDDFIAKRNSPIIAVLGKTKYSWKNSGSIFDDTLYKKYNSRAFFKEIYKQPGPKENDDDKINQPTKPIPIDEHKMDPNYKYYHVKVGNKRFLIKSQKGGSLITIKPKHTLWPRTIQVNPTYGSVVLTKGDKGEIELHYNPISPIMSMYKQGIILDMDERLKRALSDKMRYEGPKKELRVHDIIYLPATKRHGEGYFLVTKLGRSGVKVVPEDKLKIRYTKQNSKDLGSESGKDKAKDKSVEIGLNEEDLLYLYNNPDSIRIK